MCARWYRNWEKILVRGRGFSHIFPHVPRVDVVTNWTAHKTSIFFKVSNIPSLQVVMGTIGKSVTQLSSVSVLLAFYLTMFAVIGSSFLRGSFHYTCFNDTNNLIYEKGKLCGRETTHGQKCPKGDFYVTFVRFLVEKSEFKLSDQIHQLSGLWAYKNASKPIIFYLVPTKFLSRIGS